METKNNTTAKVFDRYYRVSVHGSMPHLDDINLDAWTLATERPRGSHFECGTDVEYSYWLTHSEVIDKIASGAFCDSTFAVGKLTELYCEASHWLDSLKDDPSYRDMWFCIIEHGGNRDIDGAVKNPTRPSDIVGMYDDNDRATYKTLGEVMGQCPELLPMAICVHDRMTIK